ncbi:MAG TPA: SAM-dependent methyltransferase [Acidimicrobiales bacterium]|nr:SAM-dependent methyltransferase [Acidimicrobiales bacterium]
MSQHSSVPDGPGGSPVEIDITTPHAARVYDYLLGGTTNFEADRQAAQHVAKAVGGIDNARADVRSNRDFLARAVEWLATEGGIRQFLDVGTGIPSDDNTHAVAQRVAPESRIVYVDNDPIVLAHAHELLKSTPAGTASYVSGDLREPDAILAEAAQTLDLTEPVGLVLVAILHFMRDEDDPYGIVARLLDALPAGSHLVVSHLANDIHTDEMSELSDRLNQTVRETFVLRDHSQVSRFFDGLELVEPGLVQVDEWPTPRPPVPGAWQPRFYGGVGRKPALSS